MEGTKSHNASAVPSGLPASIEAQEIHSLSERFSLDPSVRTLALKVLEDRQFLRTGDCVAFHVLAGVSRAFRRLGGWVGAWWSHSTALLASTLCLTIACLWPLGYAISRNAELQTSRAILTGLLLSAILFFVACMVTAARIGKYGKALGICALFSFVTGIGSALVANDTPDSLVQITGVETFTFIDKAALIIPSFFLILMPAFLLAVLVGQYQESQRSHRQVFRLSRQDILARLLEIESLLANDATETATAQTAATNWPAWPHKIVSCLIAGVAAGLLVWAAAGLQTVWLVGGVLFVQTLDLIILAITVYLGTRFEHWGHRILAASGFLISSTLTRLLVISGSSSFLDSGIGATLVVLPVLFAIIGIRSLTDRNRRFHSRRAKNDPAVLLAEHVRLTQQLQTKTEVATVMDVDIAGSTRLKKDADPRASEWTFRAYQECLAHIIATEEGQIISTAGDGVLAEFPDAKRAMAAAQTIHRQLDQFNMTKNRLQSPIRVRIGLHSGFIGGEASEVQFSETIDIAAHTQAAAPVGGISMTEPVRAQLSPEVSIATAEIVDGFATAIAKDPKGLG